jgi:D-alanyl-D-alanine-carboxypeptidase/D-alanyl-D-alanine-endopeptidase
MERKTERRGRITRRAWAGYIVASLGITPIAARSRILSDSQIRRVLAERIDTQRLGVGIMVGVIARQGRRLIVYGKADDSDTRSLDGDTVFEIGSVTKVFTALLLADEVQRGEVALNDPVAKYLPREVQVPEHGGKAITLESLATHTSDLPWEPTKLKPKDPDNPFRGLYHRAALRIHFRLLVDARPRSGVRVFKPRGGSARACSGETSRHRLRGTASLPNSQTARYKEHSHNTVAGDACQAGAGTQRRIREGAESKSALAGAGMLNSSANDMLTFLAAQLGFAETPLAPAMKYALAPRRPSETSGDPLG